MRSRQNIGHKRIERIQLYRASGYRTIILLHTGYRAFFVYGFAKSDRDNIRKDEEEQFGKMAKYVLGLSDVQLNVLIVKGQFEEIANDDEKISQ